MPVTRANVRHLSEMVDVASALGAEAIRFEPADADRAPSAAITADHLDAAVRHAARLRIRAVTRLPSATDEIFGHAALGGRPNRSDGSRREAQPNLLSAASAPSTLPSHSAR
ncbi:MAG: hypothetical protein IT374_06915 [Polyangiaceae bacterium]|nr:hypothetical protein [Polyangiaceae bacterium]